MTGPLEGIGRRAEAPDDGPKKKKVSNTTVGRWPKSNSIWRRIALQKDSATPGDHEWYESARIRRTDRKIRDGGGRAPGGSRRAGVTHIGLGEGVVEQVASNRRILGPDGKVKMVRYTATKDPVMRAAP